MHLISHQKTGCMNAFTHLTKFLMNQKRDFATKQSVNKNMFQRPRSDYSTERDFQIKYRYIKFL